VKLFNNKNRQLRELRHLDWIDLSLEATTIDLLFFDLVDPGSEQREISVGGATFVRIPRRIVEMGVAMRSN
jgi:hypothetical protein